MNETGEHVPNAAAAWPTEAERITNAMLAHVAPFAAPIARSLSDTTGRLEGTGNYLDLSGRKVLLSNEHVLGANRPDGRFAYRFRSSKDFVKLTPAVFAAMPRPFDVAAASISDDAWAARPPFAEEDHVFHDGKAVPEDRIGLGHVAAPNELLFVYGFAGENSSFVYDTLRTDGTGYLCREATLPERTAADNRFHFGMEYRRDAATVAGGGRGLPDPHGMSGSLVWNTRCVEITAEGKRDWTPDDAIVTGLLWAWPAEDRLVATRIEFVRSFLLRFVESYARLESARQPPT